MEFFQARFLRLFGDKPVLEVSCVYCKTLCSNRAMRSVLLANDSTELFSTDLNPISCALFGNEYLTTNCECVIRDLACRTCGNCVGYHVTMPCQSCLKGSNNGHLYMFHGYAVEAQERWANEQIVRWADVPSQHADSLSLSNRQLLGNTSRNSSAISSSVLSAGPGFLDRFREEECIR